MTRYGRFRPKLSPPLVSLNVACVLMNLMLALRPDNDLGGVYFYPVTAVIWAWLTPITFMPGAALAADRVAIHQDGIGAFIPSRIQRN